MQQHGEEKAAHASAVREQEKIQRRLLEEKIAFRKKQKDAKIAKDMSRKFREAVMNQDFLGSMANVNQADLAPQEREEVRAPPSCATPRSSSGRRRQHVCVRL
jgi:hypothetical protein